MQELSHFTAISTNPAMNTQSDYDAFSSNGFRVINTGRQPDSTICVEQLNCIEPSGALNSLAPGIGNPGIGNNGQFMRKICFANHFRITP